MTNMELLKLFNPGLNDSQLQEHLDKAGIKGEGARWNGEKYHNIEKVGNRSERKLPLSKELSPEIYYYIHK